MGCRLNHAEGAAIRGALEEAGHEVVVGALAKGSAPDAFLLHSCAVTGSAQTEALRHLRGARRAGVPLVLVSGCVANVEEPTALRAAGADCAVVHAGPVALSGGEPPALAGIVHEALARPRIRTLSHSSTRAPVKIQDGCSFRCSYCIVPDARGLPRSRPLAEVLEEVRSLAGRGYREIVLTGVNVSCWHEQGSSFVDLIRAVCAVPGLSRVRMASVEPHTTEREVIDHLAGAESRLCHMLHYPLQSGSDRILRLMRRRYTAGEYRAAVEYALARIPDIGLGADIITGFPGETDADFEETVRMVRDYPFSNLHVFPYSERPGTPAATMPDSVPVNVRRDWARHLIALGEEKRAAFAASFVGRGVEVLVEAVDAAGFASGWTGEYLRAKIPGATASDVGRLLSARAESASGDELLCGAAHE